VPFAAQCSVADAVVQLSLPGTHCPAQSPVVVSQMKGHAEAWLSIQIPLLLQVCGLFALHWV
jgi:hypothetical protein